MRHVERASRVRQTLRGHDAQHGGHAALERELDLRLMGVAGGEWHGQNVAVEEVGTPTSNLHLYMEQIIIPGSWEP